MLEVLRAILRRAHREWDWIGSVPVIRMLPEPKRRVRWLTKEEARRLLYELPAHLEALARFSLATGLRKSNVVELEWSQVDLHRCVAWIHPDQAKARRAIAVPLNDDAMAVLRTQPDPGSYCGTPPACFFLYSSFESSACTWRSSSIQIVTWSFCNARRSEWLGI